MRVLPKGLPFYNMNRITDLLDLEDANVIISDIQTQGQTKVITLETPPAAHFCPSCGFRMHSRGIKNRAITHPILQIIIL